MKIRTLAFLAGSGAALMLSGAASARFLGLSTETVPNGFGLLTVRVYAEFDAPGQDFLGVVAGVPGTTLVIEVVGGTFYQSPFGGDSPPNPYFFADYPSIRYDTFVTIGVESYNPNDPGYPEGRPSDEMFRVCWPGFGASRLEMTEGLWGIVPVSQQGDPFDPVSCFPGDGRVLVGQFSTADGTAIRGTMLLQLWSDGVSGQHVASFGGGATGSGSCCGCGGGSDDGVPTQWFVDDDGCPGTGSGLEANPFCSIQTAINAAVDGDEILVGPGSYYEAIDFQGKAITLSSSDGPEATIIDVTGLAAHAVTCGSGEGPGTVLDGFTITGGNASSGGGMSNAGSSPTVVDCVFMENFAVTGGGMYNGGGSAPTVTGCAFIGNVANYFGGGMANMNSSPTVTSCAFRGNEGVNGGGMANFDNSPVVINCAFNGNTGIVGGAMSNFNNDATVTNCTFAGNTATGASGAMHNVSSVPTVSNCILWGDLPDEFGQGDAAVSYSIVHGGWPGTGNLDTNPRFVDAAGGDLRLAPGSICMDAGDNAAVPPDVTYDLAGDPRFVDAVYYQDTGSGVAPIVDMGAYEADAATPLPDPPARIGVFRTGSWFLDLNGNDGWDGVNGGDGIFPFGLPGTDRAVMGDWDGGGVDQIGIFRNGSWYLDLNGNGGWDGVNGGDAILHFGLPGLDTPVVGDWNGDGVDQVGVFRNGSWYLDLNGNDQWDGVNGGDGILHFGLPGLDTPVVGDWNGDGVDQIGVFRNGSWYLDLNGNDGWDGVNGGDGILAFGLPAGDTPVVGDWIGDGVDHIGVFRNGSWFLDLNGNDAWNGVGGGDAIIQFGLPGIDQPVVGAW